MHSIIVLVWCLRVNLPEIEWRIDLPELISIQLGTSAFRFTDDKSSELIMRSDDDEMNWWIDLPKLTTLTANGNRSYSFQYPRSITLESAFCLFILTSRHALSHWCVFLSRISLPGQRCSFWRSASFHLVHSKILVISLIMLCHFHNETVIKSFFQHAVSLPVSSTWRPSNSLRYNLALKGNSGIQGVWQKHVSSPVCSVASLQLLKPPLPSLFLITFSLIIVLPFAFQVKEGMTIHSSLLFNCFILSRGWFCCFLLPSSFLQQTNREWLHSLNDGDSHGNQDRTCDHTSRRPTSFQRYPFHNQGSTCSTKGLQ